MADDRPPPFQTLTPAERTMRSRMAAHTSWANTADRTARTKHALDAFLDRFEREVDPDGTMDPAERSKRAESAKKAYFTRRAYKSAQTRRRKRES